LGRKDAIFTCKVQMQRALARKVEVSSGYDVDTAFGEEKAESPVLGCITVREVSGEARFIGPLCTSKLLDEETSHYPSATPPAAHSSQLSDLPQ